MKKLLLLPLLSLTLVGCNGGSNVTSRQWHTLGESQYLYVCYGSQSQEYLGTNYKKVQYYSVYTDGGITMLEVKYVLKGNTNTQEYSDTYWGSTVSYVVRDLY